MPDEGIIPLQAAISLQGSDQPGFAYGHKSPCTPGRPPRTRGQRKVGESKPHCIVLHHMPLLVNVTATSSAATARRINLAGICVSGKIRRQGQAHQEHARRARNSDTRSFGKASQIPNGCFAPKAQETCWSSSREDFEWSSTCCPGFEENANANVSKCSRDCRYRNGIDRGWVLVSSKSIRRRER
jgi:hypothetical protein